ncbi:MAG: MFS transporter [Candidatus Bathyarchaeia archaeon]
MALNIYNVMSKFFRTLDSRFKVMLVAVGLYSWIRGLPSQYNQLYASALGANPVELGSLESIGGVANSIISAPTGWFIDKYGVKRVIIFGFILSAIVSGIYSAAVDWWMLIPAIILAQISMRMIVPLTDIIFIGTTKPRERALAMGFSRTVWAIPNVFAPMTAAVIVAIFGGINVQGIRPLYVIQLASIAFVILFVAFLLKASSTRPIVDKDGSTMSIGIIEDFKDLFKGVKWLKHWTVIISAWRLGMSAAIPFIPLWMVNVKGADPYILGLMGTIGIITSALLQIPAGKLADRIGRKRVFLLLRPFAYLGTILLILAPSPEFLIPVGALGVAGMMIMGGIGNVSFVPFITMYWEMVPAEKRGRWFGFTGIFNILIVPASILGGLMWQAGLMELVLFLPVLVEVLIVVPMLAIIPDTLSRSN